MNKATSAWLDGRKFDLTLTQRYVLFLGAVIAALLVASLVITTSVMRDGLSAQFQQRMEQSKLALDHYARVRYYGKVSKITTVLSSPRFIAAVSTLDSGTIAAEAPVYRRMLDCEFLVCTDAGGDVVYTSQPLPRAALALMKGAIRDAVDSPLVSYVNLNNKVYEIYHARIVTGDGLGLGAVAVGTQLGSSLIEDLAQLTGFDVIVTDQTDVIGHTTSPLVANALASPEQFSPRALPLGEFQTTSVAGEKVIFLAIPCPQLNCVVTFMGSVDANISGIMSNVRQHLIEVGIVGAILALIAIYLFTARRIGRQVNSLVSATSRIASGDLNFKLAATSRDEFGQLSVEVEGMRANLLKNRQELEKAQGEQLRAERLSTVGKLATGIIHDFKNPMSVIRGTVELMELQAKGDDKQANRLSTIMQQIDRMADLTRDVLEYSKGRTTLDLEAVSLVEYFSAIRDAHVQLLERAGITLDVQKIDDARVRLDPKRFRRVIDNILNNAREALRPNDRVVISWRQSNDQLVVTIADSGPGIPEEICATLFDAFVTSGKEGGTGLGLAISKKIVEDHGATITVDSKPECGASFAITLPASMIVTASEVTVGVTQKS